MIEFTCTCQWKWVLDLRHNQVWGPIYMSVFSDGSSPLLSTGKRRTFEQFDDQYSDCFGDALRKLEGTA